MWLLLCCCCCCYSQPKLWDWDGLDNDFNSATGSNGGGAAAPAIAAAPAQPLGLRPTTAAAVIGSGVPMDGDLMGGGERDDLEEDFDQRGPGDRPTTAGAMLQYGSRAASGGGAAWGYARQEVGGAGKAGAGAGIADYGADNGAARRPHTAHGARATPTYGGQMMSGAANPGMDPKAMQYGAEQDVSA